MEFSESLKAKLADAETLEDVAKLCAEEGLDVTLEQLQAVEASQNGELNENDLDNVAGGLMAGPALIIGLYGLWCAIRRKK